MRRIIASAFGRLKKKSITLELIILISLCIISAAGTAIALNSIKEGLVEYIGAQKDIFATGKAASVVSLEEVAGRKSLYAMGPIDGLDGEITIFDSKPYITKVRGDDYIVDKTFKHGAFFLVWTEQSKWRDIPIPAEVKGYVDLQQFVKAKAKEAGIDVTKPFPFLLSGTPVGIKWHINVDKTEGKAITKELFAKSKASYVLKNEPVDIIGFYSENHPGVFISQYAPAIDPKSGVKNAIHIHVVSMKGKAAGHIDDITLGEGMTLRLPKL